MALCSTEYAGLTALWWHLQVRYTSHLQTGNHRQLSYRVKLMDEPGQTSFELQQNSVRLQNDRCPGAHWEQKSDIRLEAPGDNPYICQNTHARFARLHSCVRYLPK